MPTLTCEYCKGDPCNCLFVSRRRTEIKRYRQQIWIAVSIVAVGILGFFGSWSFSLFVVGCVHGALDVVFYRVGVKVASDELATRAPQPEARKIGGYMHALMFMVFGGFVAFEAITRAHDDPDLEPRVMLLATLAELLGNVWQVAISRRARANITEWAVDWHNLLDVLAASVAFVAGILACYGVRFPVDTWGSLVIAAVMVF